MPQQFTTYSATYKVLNEFESVEDFWRTWNNLPQATTIFNGTATAKIEDCSVCGYSIFETNVKPEWEDPNNKDGCEFWCKITTDKIGEIWKNVCLLLIGNVLDEKVTGIRLMHKVLKHNRINVKLEVWIRNNKFIDEVKALLEKEFPDIQFLLSYHMEVQKEIKRISIRDT